MYEDIYFKVRDIEEDVSSEDTDEQLYDNSLEEDENSDSFQSCEESSQEEENLNVPSLKMFSELFNQIISKIRTKAQNN